MLSRNASLWIIYSFPDRLSFPSSLCRGMHSTFLWKKILCQLYCTGLLNQRLVVSRIAYDHQCWNVFQALHSIPLNIIASVDELETLLRRPIVSNEPLYHTAHESKGVLEQEAESMNAWMQAFEDCDIKNAKSTNEEKFERNCERAKMTEDTTKGFPTGLERNFWLKLRCKSLHPIVILLCGQSW